MREGVATEYEQPPKDWQDLKDKVKHSIHGDDPKPK